MSTGIFADDARTGKRFFRIAHFEQDAGCAGFGPEKCECDPLAGSAGLVWRCGSGFGLSKGDNGGEGTGWFGSFGRRVTGGSHGIYGVAGHGDWTGSDGFKDAEDPVYLARVAHARDDFLSHITTLRKADRGAVESGFGGKHSGFEVDSPGGNSTSNAVPFEIGGAYLSDAGVHEKLSRPDSG
jgi:hypothetical protein